MTNPKNNTSNPGRRSFLLKAATVAAGSAALTVAAGSSVLAYQNGPDPILATIEAHRAATAALRSVLDVHTMLERKLPRDKRESSVDAWEEKIVASDDPRWIDCERAVSQAFDAETDAAIEPLNVRPATALGFISLLQYVTAADRDGETWPCELLSDDGSKTRSWHHFFIENVADMLPAAFPDKDDVVSAIFEDLRDRLMAKQRRQSRKSQNSQLMAPRLHHQLCRRCKVSDRQMQGKRTVFDNAKISPVYRTTLRVGRSCG
jgi:hypothetical protein